MKECLKAEDLVFRYQHQSDSHIVLDHISLTIDSTNFTCLTGPSGSGKSTLLNILGLLETPQSGELHIFGERVVHKSKKLDEIRKEKIGFIFQDFQLLDVLTAEENVDYFLDRLGLPYFERKKRIQTFLTKVGLWDFRGKKPSELSGGQKQRLAIARALAKSPLLIIADEPTANLDQENAIQVLKTLRDLTKDQGVTVIMASHDPSALQFCDLSFAIKSGKCVNTRKSEASHAA